MSQVTIAALEQARRQAPRLPAIALIADSLGWPAADWARLAEAVRHPGSYSGFPPAWVIR